MHATARTMLVALIAIASAFLSPSADAQDGRYALPIKEHLLDNGLRLLVLERPGDSRVVCKIFTDMGALNETPGQYGAAHFLEHLMFKGTETIGPGEFSEIVARNGGTDNAFTSWDYTGYFQRVAADRLGLMMEMEADRMRNITLTEEDIAVELDVVSAIEWPVAATESAHGYCERALGLAAGGRQGGGHANGRQDAKRRLWIHDDPVE